MSEYKTMKQKKARKFAAALATATSIILGAWLYRLSDGNVALIWVSTAVYMLGPIVATLIVWPVVAYDGWLFTTAVLLSLAVVVPWSFINPTKWVTVLLPQFGMWANILFVILLISAVSEERLSRKMAWGLTGFYLLLMVGLPIVY